MHIPTGWATTTASPPRAHQRSPVRHAPLPCPNRVVKTMRRACQQLSHLAGSPAVPVQMVNAGGCAVPVYGSAFPDQQSCGAHSFHSSCHVPAPSMFQQEQQLLPGHLHHQQQQPSFSGGFSGPLPPLGHGAPVMGFPPPAFHDPSLHVPDMHLPAVNQSLRAGDAGFAAAHAGFAAAHFPHYKITLGVTPRVTPLCGVTPGVIDYSRGVTPVESNCN